MHTSRVASWPTSAFQTSGDSVRARYSCYGSEMHNVHGVQSSTSKHRPETIVAATSVVMLAAVVQAAMLSGASSVAVHASHTSFYGPVHVRL
eukprot:8476-Heterococcus_DN1.PRE.1